MLRTKVYRAEHIKVLDEKQGRISATVSSESMDRDGDIVRARGWNLDNFLRHPVLLASHDYSDLRSQIGIWENVEIEGESMRGVARFFIGKGNDVADWAFELAKEKALAFSVGFIPDMEKATPLSKDSMGGGGMEFDGQELLEVSAVTVPSNPDALQRRLKSNLHPVVAEIVAERIKADEPEDADETAFTLDDVAARVLEMLDERNTESDDADVDVPAPEPDEPVADEDSDDEEGADTRQVETDADDQIDNQVETDDGFDAYEVALAAAEQALNELDEQEAAL